MKSEQEIIANSCIKMVSSLIVEFEESKILPNLLLVDQQTYNSLKKYYPYLFLESNALCYNNKTLKIVITTDSNILGLCLCYYIDNIKDYEKCEHIL